jgi:PAS domain S-box-containing protein
MSDERINAPSGAGTEQLRELLARADAHLAAIVESSDDAIMSKSLEGTILSWNKGAERIFGYTAEEAVGKSIYLLIPRDRWDEEPRILDKLKRGERIDHYETVRLTKDQRAVDVSLSISPVKDSQGKIVAASKIARDITARKQAEREREQLLVREQEARTEAERRLRESQLLAEATQLFSASLQVRDLLPVVCRSAREIANADGAAFILREGDRVHYVEEDAVAPLWKGQLFPINDRISGWAILEHKPAIIEDVYADDRVQAQTYEPTFVKSLLIVPVRGHDPLEAIGVYWARNHRADEREVALLEALADAAHIALINTRLYEQTRAAREQAEEASRAKDEFLATLSHELRTPLNAIIGWTGIIAGGKFHDGDTVNRAIETIDRNARLQARLIDDMLDMSRIVSGKLRLEPHQVDLPAVIHAAVDTVRSAADAKNIRIDIVLAYGAGLVFGDAVRLQQIVWNLLSNAIKFTPKRGRVQVQLARVDSQFEIVVSDSGSGIDESFLPYVFDRFRQADSSSSRKHGGLGLGLSIVRHLVELHGGTIEASNRADGSGAVFTIRLPLMAARKPELSSATRPDVAYPISGALSFDCPPALNGLKVLVVDDDADSRRLLTTILEQCKAEIMTCSSTAEALEAVKQLKPDVLVSDIGMPDEDGYVLIEKLRTLETDRLKRIPAVALTAYASAEDRVRALAAGYNMHVPKPVEPAELVVVIASLTGRSTKASKR